MPNPTPNVEVVVKTKISFGLFKQLAVVAAWAGLNREQVYREALAWACDSEDFAARCQSLGADHDK